MVDEAKRIVQRTVKEVRESEARAASDVAVIRDARKQRLEREWGTECILAGGAHGAVRVRLGPARIQQVRTAADQIDAAMIAQAARDDLDLHRYIEAVRSPRRK